jgi:hypothetical protein
MEFQAFRQVACEAGGCAAGAMITEPCLAASGLLDLPLAERLLRGDQGMGSCRLALSVFALGLLLAISPAPARANGAVASAAIAGIASAKASEVVQVGVLHHSKKARSYYCYPRTYWWFYRPYTTGKDGHPRCMPYFHIPGGEAQYFKGAPPGRIK